MFRCLAVEVRCGCVGGVGCDGRGVGGVVQYGWASGAGDVVVGVAGWDGVWVDPTFRFGGVEL